MPRLTSIPTPDLPQVFGDGSGLDVVLISLADPPKKVDGVGVAEVPVQGLQDVTLGLEDLGFGVGGVRTVEKVSSRRGNDLFHLRSDEHTRDPHELQFDEGDDTGGKETINDIDAEEKGLRE